MNGLLVEKLVALQAKREPKYKDGKETPTMRNSFKKDVTARNVEPSPSGVDGQKQGCDEAVIADVISTETLEEQMLALTVVPESSAIDGETGCAGVALKLPHPWQGPGADRAREEAEATEAIAKVNEIMVGLVAGRQALSPEENAERVNAALGMVVTDPALTAEARAILLDGVSRTAPKAVQAMIEWMAKIGMFQRVAEDGEVLRFAVLLKSELIRELGLATASELSVLDVAMNHWVEGKTAYARAKAAGKTSDYVKLMALSLAAYRSYASLIQSLRNRNRHTIRTLQVAGASHVGIQINEAPPPQAHADRRAVPSRPVPATDDGDTHDLGINEKGT